MRRRFASGVTSSTARPKPRSTPRRWRSAIRTGAPRSRPCAKTTPPRTRLSRRTALRWSGRVWRSRGMLALTLGGLFATVGATQDQNKMITNAIGMKLTLIPAGKFLMGSPTDEAERDADEGQHEVVITKPFYMGVYEVTQREYER